MQQGQQTNSLQSVSPYVPHGADCPEWFSLFNEGGVLRKIIGKWNQGMRVFDRIQAHLASFLKVFPADFIEHAITQLNSRRLHSRFFGTLAGAQSLSRVGEESQQPFATHHPQPPGCQTEGVLHICSHPKLLIKIAGLRGNLAAKEPEGAALREGPAEMADMIWGRIAAYSVFLPILGHINIIPITKNGLRVLLKCVQLALERIDHAAIIHIPQR